MSSIEIRDSGALHSIIRNVLLIVLHVETFHSVWGSVTVLNYMCKVDLGSSHDKTVIKLRTFFQISYNKWTNSGTVLIAGTHERAI